MSSRAGLFDPEFNKKSINDPEINSKGLFDADFSTTAGGVVADILSLYQPDFSRYPAQNFRYPSMPSFVVHQGATVQQTFPVPTVTMRPELRSSAINVARYLSALFPQPNAAVVADTLLYSPNQPVTSLARAQVHVIPRFDGALVQQLHLVTQTNQPERSRFWPTWDANRVALGSGNVGPDPQLDGPTTQPWFIYPTAQPEFIRFGLKETARRLSGPAPQFDGATIQQQYVFPVSLPEMRFYPPTAHRYLPYPTSPQSVIVTVDPRYDLYPANQPDLARVAGLHLLRYQIQAIPQFDGATSQQGYVFPVSLPELIAFVQRERIRQLGGPIAQLTGATSQQQYLFPVAIPDLRFYPSVAHRYLPYPAPPQPVIVTIDPRYDVYPTGQPDMAHVVALKESIRPLGRPIAQLEGATLQPWYIYPTSQPDQRAFYPARNFAGALLPQSGVVVAPQTYIFVVSQPELTAFSQRFRQLGGPIAQTYGVTVQDTIPTPGVTGPELTAFALKEWTRRHGGPMPQLTGATTQQTHPTPGVTGPEFAYIRLERARRFVGPTPQFEGVTRQQTHPTPGISQPEMIRFALKEWVRRYGGSEPQLSGIAQPPEILVLSGLYTPVITETGIYLPALSVTGQDVVSIAIVGVFRLV